MVGQPTLLSKRASTTLFKVRDWNEDSARGQDVVLKVLDAERPGVEQLGRFLHELEVSRILMDAGVSSIRRGFGRTRFEGRHALVLEYIEGIELSELSVPQSLEQLRERLMLGASLSKVLAAIHDAKVIHRDLKPSNVILSPSGKICVIDLGQASLIDVQTLELGNPAKLEGTLLYMSPEQTGRMNRTVDYRTDLYSLGATLYQLLTGQPPFSSLDSLELVHCHLARRPLPPHQINPLLPEAVSQIVLRLLEKNPSDRYQSANGVENDLTLLSVRLAQGKSLVGVELGRSDTPIRFTVVEKLYGREEQEAALLAAFERVRGQRVELVTLGGLSGVGKSALVGQVYKPMTERKGNAAWGKFDQLSRAIPYSAFTQAFTDLVSLLLTYDDDTLAMWQRGIHEAVGDLGGVLLGLMPNLPLVLGKLQPVPTLEGAAAQNRLQWVARAFVRAVSRREHPLVLFLDDVQWADVASLELMEALLTDPDGKHLLMIMAYRDNEVSANHSLHQVIETAEGAGIEPVRLTMDNLRWRDVATMIVDSTHASRANAEVLAHIIQEKTRGNPFFVHQFLMMLADRKLLEFQPSEGCWGWSTEAVRAVEVTENVVDLLVIKIRTLPEASQRALMIAASLGNRFDLAQLSELMEQSRISIKQLLEPVLAMGLLSPLDRSYLEVEAAAEISGEANARFKFVHDRVQQAAYGMFGEEERQKTHLEAGRILARTLKGDEDQRVFDASRHLSAAQPLLTDRGERCDIAALELRAGYLAFVAGAYHQALDHAERGLSLLPEDAWQSAYKVKIDLELLASKIAALVLDEERVRRASREVLQHAKTGLEKASAYSDLALLAMTQEDLNGAVELGRKALLELGVRFPQRPTIAHVLISLLRVKLTLRGRIEELAEGNPLTDPRVEAALIIMDRLLPAAFRAGSKLFPLFVFEMVRLASIHGLSCYSVAAYASFAIAQCAVLKDYDTGYRFAMTAIKIGERYPRAMGYAVPNMFIRHWKESLNTTVEGLRQGARLSMELGDVYQGTWCACYSSLFMFVSGVPLKKVLGSYQSHGDSLLFDEGAEGMRKMVTQAIRNLTTPQEIPHRLEGEDYNEAWVLRRFRERNDATEIGHYHNFSLQLCVFFEKTEEGLAHADALEKYVDGLNPMYFWVLMHFLSAIVRLRGYMLQKNRSLLSKARASLKVLRRCAVQNPNNYSYMPLLIEAMLAEQQGNNREAAALHSRAIETSRRNGAPAQDQALCLELASSFHRRGGDPITASTLQTQAAQEYLAWGATALHLRLAAGISYGPASTETVPSSHTSRSTLPSNSASSLDLMSVVKASQVISGALVLEDLLDQLLRAMIQNAGAERGILIMKGGRPLVVEANNSSEHAEVSSQSVEDRSDLARMVVRYVERTKENVVLADTSADGPFVSDPYLVRSTPMSLLCMPILRQQRLVGLLYLENRLVTDAFTAARCEFLEIFSVQAAISLENALLYDTLDARVREQTSQIRDNLDKLEKIQAALQAELSDAADYVRSLLPSPLMEGPVRTDWHYVPSAQLGGDGLGYLFLEDGRFAFFVLDVAGHGFASALLCISILTALHSRRLLGADFGDPTSVLRALNAAFPISTGGRHFTMWYGVLDPQSRELAFANGGHPNAVLCDRQDHCRELGEPGLMLGVLSEAEFPTEKTTLSVGERIYVFSDGAYEVSAPDGAMLDYQLFLGELSKVKNDIYGVERLLRFATAQRQVGELEDDFTVLSVYLQ